MADDSNDAAERRKRTAESAAKVVLAKHPHVVAGIAPPPTSGGEVSFARPVDIGARNIGRGMMR